MKLTYRPMRVLLNINPEIKWDDMKFLDMIYGYQTHRALFASDRFHKWHAFIVQK